MRIDTLTLINFRLFEQLTVDFHSKLTVLVANNGGGKTSLLDALAIGLSDYVGNLPIHNRQTYQIEFNDRRRVMTNNGVLPAETTILQFKTYSDRSKQAGFVTRTHKGMMGISVRNFEFTDDTYFIPNDGISDALARLAVEDYRAVLEKNNQHTLPVIAYYGTKREWQNVEALLPSYLQNRADDDLLSRISPYSDCLHSQANYITFFDWFQYISKVHADERIKLLDKFGEKSIGMSTTYGEMIKAIRDTVDTCLNNTGETIGWHNLAYSHEQQKIMMEHSSYGEMPLNQLSDGIRNTVAWVADIALRCVRLNKHLGIRACLETTGVVLIDEIDLHLHPSWQQRIVSALQQAFPKVQFIVTTHSPQVLSTVPNECIRILDSETLITQQTQGVPSNVLLATLMNVNPIPDMDITRQLSRYKSLIQQDLHTNEEGEKLYSRLSQHFGKSHPELLDCERLIRLQEMKRKMAEHKAGKGAE